MTKSTTSRKEIPPPPVACKKVLKPIGHAHLEKFTVEVCSAKDVSLALFTLATVNRAAAIKRAEAKVREKHALASSVTLLVKVI